MFDVLNMIDQWLTENQPVVLATVVQTWGSSPRQAGAKMAFTPALNMVGSVSGGCVEGAVIEEGIASLNDQKPRLLHYGVADDTAWEVGLACGGTIEVFVEPLDTMWWQHISQYSREHQGTTTAVILQGERAGERVLVDASGNLLYASKRLNKDQVALLVQAASEDTTQRKIVGDFDVLVDVQRPQPRLMIIGGGHVSMALHSFAHQMGFQVTVIDPRTAFSTPDRFPHAGQILHTYPDKAMPQVGLDTNTYIAVLTHDPKIDDPALLVALASPAPYIGVLSSRRTHEQRTQRLLEKGVTAEQLARIRTPIGLPIGGQTPEEIALCIMAEIVAVRNSAV